MVGTSKKSKSKKSKSKSKKPLNAFMVALSKARSANADSFVYNGKTYYKKLAKTGIPLYSSTKTGGGYKKGGMGCSSGSKKSRMSKKSKKSRSKKGGMCGCEKTSKKKRSKSKSKGKRKK